MNRQFTAAGPDQLWLTEITEHPTGEGKLCLCAVRDVWSNRIAGYSMDSRMTAALAVSALRNAIALRSPALDILAEKALIDSWILRGWYGKCRAQWRG